MSQRARKTRRNTDYSGHSCFVKDCNQAKVDSRQRGLGEWKILWSALGGIGET